MRSVADWSTPASTYQLSFATVGDTPVNFQTASSLTCVPDESAREMNGARAAAIRRNASAAVVALRT